MLASTQTSLKSEKRPRIFQDMEEAAVVLLLSSQQPPSRRREQKGWKMLSMSPDAPSLECLQQRDSNLAHSSSELTGKQWNSVLLFFSFFLSEREKGRREKLARAANLGNRPDKSYCYEISLFHGQDHYISLAGQTKHHVSPAEASLLPRGLDRGKQNFRKELAWKGIRVQLSLKHRQST